MMRTKIRKALALHGRFWRYLLHLCFGFDKWHIVSLYDRKYATDIIRFLNSKDERNRNSVAEIGCGLGDVLRKVRYKKKTGYDMDANVLRAATFLSRATFKSGINYKLFRFPESQLTGKVDTLILVNWIHHVSPLILKKNIEEYFHNHLSTEGEIVVDTVQDKDYEINHSIDFLVSNLHCHVIKIGDDIKMREIFAIRKK
jgi:SAM-dependent methyltransferase